MTCDMGSDFDSVPVRTLSSFLRPDPGCSEGQQEEDEEQEEPVTEPSPKQAAISARQVDAAQAFLYKCVLGVAREVVNNPATVLQSVLPNPTKDVCDVVHRLLMDLALTREQQEVLESAILSNTRFWRLSISGSGEQGAVPWRRHLALNLALLQVYHRQLAAKTYASIFNVPVDALLAESGVHRFTPQPSAADEAGAGIAEVVSAKQLPTPPMRREVAEAATRYCRFAAAAYSQAKGRAPSSLSEEELRRRTAAMVDLEVSDIFHADLHNSGQLHDPLLPRHYLALDHAKGEAVLVIRGTSSISDLLSDLRGEPMPFAGGVAVEGMVHGARRLFQKIEAPLREAIQVLRDRHGKARLVLVGHSLGAGIASLFAIILKGGDISGDGDQQGCWCLPSDVQLAAYLYAPPPCYHSGAVPSGRKSGLSSDDLTRARVAVKAAAQCSVGFALNYDGIPRISLQNGFKLFQHARLVDTLVLWRKRKIVRALQEVSRLDETGVAAREEVFSAVTSAIHAAATSLPAPESPFPRQVQLVACMYHVIGVPGGTFAFGKGADAITVQRLPSSCGEASSATEAGEGSADEASRTTGFWLQKKSRVIGEWRRRFAWISADGMLYFAVDDRADIERKTTVVPLTAGASWVRITGQPSRRAWKNIRVVDESTSVGDPANFTDQSATGDCVTASVPLLASGIDTVAEESPVADMALTGADSAWSLASSSRNSRVPREWGLLVETESVSGICPTQAVAVSLVFDSSELRDAFVDKVVEAMEQAADACFRMQPPVPPENFGTEFFLADGCMTDHSIIRYSSALEAAARASPPSAGDHVEIQTLEDTAREEVAHRKEERSRRAGIVRLMPYLACLHCLGAAAPSK